MLAEYPVCHNFIYMKNKFFNLVTIVSMSFIPMMSFAQSNNPVRVAVAGTSHGHSGWILDKKNHEAITVVGIFEKNNDLTSQHIQRLGLDKKLFYTSLEKMLDELKPEAVVAFGSIYEHLEVVEACAPRGIHVMVEKPLAVSMEHAERMHQLAKKHNIHLLTNYETSWYPVTVKVSQMVKENYAGKIRKAVFHHGHEGPKEIGVSKEFFNWLTDPVQNGGGAIVDFGCYGANIMTELMGVTKPVAVTALTNTFKPGIYPKVDDEATILVEYPEAHCIIQASWNWPFGRKDMEVYGETGYMITTDANHMRYRNKGNSEKKDSISVEATSVYTDPFKYFADVIRKKITVPKYGLYSLENNMLVVEILEKARESARTGKKIKF